MTVRIVIAIMLAYAVLQILSPTLNGLGQWSAYHIFQYFGLV